MVTKLYQFHNVPLILPIFRKGRTTVECTWWRHRNANNKDCPPKNFSANSVPASYSQHCHGSVRNSCNTLKQWFSTWGSRPPSGSFARFLGSRELLIIIFMITSRLYTSYMEPLFVIAKIIGSLGKNDSLLFHSKLVKMWLWPSQYCCVGQGTNNFGT